MKPNRQTSHGYGFFATIALFLWVTGQAWSAPPDNLPPAVQFTSPADGTVVTLGEKVLLEAVAEDPDGYASYLEFYDGAEKIGESLVVFIRKPDDGSPITHSYDWIPRATGKHILTAKAIDDGGAEGLSQPIAITVVAAGEGLPRITAIWIERQEVVVTCEIPAGLRKVTLESRTRATTGAWQPKAVQRLDGTGGKLTFRLEKSAALELLRVRADAQESLPASFYAGKTNFNGEVGVSAGGGPKYWTLDGRNQETTAAPSDQSREVVESDIWKIRGNTLFFFNQYRGLQVIDLTQPDAPVLKSTLSLPAAGEQMYVIEDRYVVLLARDLSGSTDVTQSQIVVVDVTGAPAIVARQPVTGTIQESRLVGTALYVASDAYKQVTLPAKPDDPDGRGETIWEWGSVVTSFDLSQPAAPAIKGTLWYTGYGNVIQATDRLLMVSSQSPVDYWQSTLRLIDISSPDGVMRELATLTPAGRIADKFKMNVADDVLAVISEAWNRQSGADSQRVSVLQTFSLADPTAPQPLGKLEVGHGEGLYATRFDGDRVYIVTFLRIDPLWVVDFSDPANPKLHGELEVPGYSTYIHPLGDRLVTIGLDNSNSWKVAISLFDVKDPTHPGLLAKVPLGENSSWSEATDDEKAFSVLPDAGLILVPYQSWGTNGYASRVQLIDLGPDSLKARGIIEHSLQPRRATVYGDRIVSISGRELMTVDATDRDHPKVTSTLELSWRVDQVFLAGDYLLEISEGESWGASANPTLRVVRQNQTDDVLDRYEITNGLAVLGAARNDQQFYLLQGQLLNGSWAVPIIEDKDGSETTPPPPTSTMVLSVFDLGQLPKLRLVGQTEIPVEPLYSGASYRPVWPKPDLLVWAGNSGGWYRYWYFLDMARISFAPWYSSANNGRLYAFDVTEAASPQAVSQLNLAGTNSWWDYSESFTSEGMLFLSHQGSEFLEGVTPSWYGKPSPEIIVNADGTKTTNIPPVGIYVTKHYLDVVDYADPANPEVRKPVNLPGQLAGLSHQGAMLYTIGLHWDANWASDGSEYLDASAYDGVSVSLVDYLKLTNSWPRPLSLPDAKFLAIQNDPDGTSRLVTWQFSLAGKFVTLGEIKLAASPWDLKHWGDLLALHRNQNIDLYSIGNPAVPTFLLTGDIPGWTWPELEAADGSVQEGLWLPMNDYGVLGILIGRKP